MSREIIDRFCSAGSYNNWLLVFQSKYLLPGLLQSDYFKRTSCTIFYVPILKHEFVFAKIFCQFFKKSPSSWVQDAEC